MFGYAEGKSKSKICTDSDHGPRSVVAAIFDRE